MKENVPLKQIWEAKVTRNRRRGRPKNTWNDEEVANMRKRNLTWSEAYEMAKNRYVTLVLQRM